jgi:sugar lactone lactonase YvrE
MAAQGQSFFAAEGDDDAWTGLIPFPCDTPYITLVGGTMLNTTGPLGTYVSESVWNENNCYGSGGGISTQYPIPTWQQGINMTANLGSTTMRNTPDVAMTAINVYVQVDGESYTVGGTSCAAPLWAAFTSLINQQAVANDRATVGFINPAIYAIGKGSGYTADFHDTTVGNNFSSSSPAKFPAETGFDLCTGWGTPNGINLIYALAGPPAPVISTGSPLPDGAVGAAYTTTLAATGGVPPYTWAISAGNLPAGLTISSTTGTISGTPVASGTASFTVQVTGSNGFSSTTPFTLPIYAQGTPIIATASPLATGTVGSAYGQTLAASGGATPYSWSMASGNLPAGLALSSTGLVSGTPTATGSSQFTMTVTGSDGLASTSPFFMIVNPPPPAITGSLSITGTIGVPLSYPITATNNPTSFSATGLPAGLSLNTFTGVISGTATGTSNVTIAAANVSGSGTATLNIVISPDQLSYFTMSYISSPQISNAPFTVSITAYDVNNIVFAGYSGTLSLTGSGSTGFVPVSPATASDFVNGIWSGSVTVQGIASDVFLTANDGLGHSVTSDGFNIGSGPLDHFAWSVVGSPQQAAVPFPVTITAQDAGNNTVTSYSGTASLSCVGGGQSIGISPATTGAFTSGVWSGNVTLAQVAAGAILRATNGIVDFYIADSYNCTIRKMTAAGVVTTIAGTPVLQGTADGIGSAALFDHPYGVAVDGSGNIYVADTANSTIRKISPARVVTTIAGMPGISGTNDGAGSAARFNNPYGLTLDGSGNIYIGDTYNETIQKMTPAGVVTTIGGTGGVTGTQGGVGPAAAFNAPEGLCVSPTNGAIYVADSANNRISEGIPTGVGQYTWSNFIGNPAIEGGTDGTGSGALLDNPIDVTLDGSGNLLVVSSNGETVRRATPAGVVTTIAGVNATPGSANGTGSTARFYAPNGIGLDLSGNAFVVDSAYSTIREVTPAGVVTTVAGSPANYGYADGTGSLAQFHYPNGAATDTGGDPGYSNPFNVIDIPNLSVSPSTGLSASGTEGGPFSPATTLYTISNVGTGPMSWSVSGTSGWLTYVPPGGTIASGSSIPLSVTINSFANTLIPGSYGDTINFTNTTNGLGDTTLPAALNIFQQYQPVITSTLNAMGVPGVPFTYQILATNAPTSYNASSLPTGLTVNTSNGLITGTTSTSGTSDVTIYASNAAGTGSASLILVIQSSFASWQARWFSPVQLANAAISGATATPAGDGIPNLLKYALNLNPFTNGTSGLPVGSSVTIGGRIYPILTYT